MTSCCSGSLPNWLARTDRASCRAPEAQAAHRAAARMAAAATRPHLPPGGADLAGLGGGQKVLGDGRLLLGVKRRASRVSR